MVHRRMQTGVTPTSEPIGLFARRRSPGTHGPSRRAQRRSTLQTPAVCDMLHDRERTAPRRAVVRRAPTPARPECPLSASPRRLCSRDVPCPLFLLPVPLHLSWSVVPAARRRHRHSSRVAQWVCRRAESYPMASIAASAGQSKRASLIRRVATKEVSIAHIPPICPVEVPPRVEILSADDWLALPDAHRHHELVAGHLTLMPTPDLRYDLIA